MKTKDKGTGRTSGLDDSLYKDLGVRLVGVPQQTVSGLLLRKEKDIFLLARVRIGQITDKASEGTCHDDGNKAVATEGGVSEGMLQYTLLRHTQHQKAYSPVYIECS